MNYSILGLLTSFFLLAVLSGCIPPSKEIIEIEKRIGSTVNQDKTADILPVADFDPPEDPKASENDNP